MAKFKFDNYSINYSTGLAEFNYTSCGGCKFHETVKFDMASQVALSLERREIVDKALFLAFVLIGTSYYKVFPTAEVELGQAVDEWQANFFNLAYQEGLGQFAFENDLTRNNLAHFKPGSKEQPQPKGYSGRGVLSLQSGGKDSLLTATLLHESNIEFIPWFLASGNYHPKVLDRLKGLKVARRSIDRAALEQAEKQGALNGHVPITYVVQSLAVVQAVLLGLDTVLVSIGHEGAEPTGRIYDLEVNHQWSKTWLAEQKFQDYVKRYISPDIKIGSPLRQFSELKIAELFAGKAWQQFGKSFSSCNVANYRQHADNSKLKWCGDCPKCANTFLLFAPFVPASELKAIFGGQDLFTKPSLEHTFKGLLGIDEVAKPFECVGETAELRLAYHMAQACDGYGELPFEVPQSDFDYNKYHDTQPWAGQLFGGNHATT